METMRTLETVEARVKEHAEKSTMHKISTSQRIGTNIRRVLDQSSKHKDDMERLELEK